MHFGWKPFWISYLWFHATSFSWEVFETFILANWRKLWECVDVIRKIFHPHHVVLDCSRFCSKCSGLDFTKFGLILWPISGSRFIQYQKKIVKSLHWKIYNILLLPFIRTNFRSNSLIAWRCHKRQSLVAAFF